MTPVSAYTQDKKGDRSSRTVTIAKRRTFVIVSKNLAAAIRDSVSSFVFDVVSPRAQLAPCISGGVLQVRHSSSDRGPSYSQNELSFYPSSLD